jgi:hypothetical protein
MVQAGFCINALERLQGGLTRWYIDGGRDIQVKNSKFNG